MLAIGLLAAMCGFCGQPDPSHGLPIEGVWSGRFTLATWYPNSPGVDCRPPLGSRFEFTAEGIDVDSGSFVIPEDKPRWRLYAQDAPAPKNGPGARIRMVYDPMFLGLPRYLGQSRQSYLEPGDYLWIGATRYFYTVLPDGTGRLDGICLFEVDALRVCSGKSQP